MKQKNWNKILKLIPTGRKEGGRETLLYCIVFYFSLFYFSLFYFILFDNQQEERKGWGNKEDDFKKKRKNSNKKNIRSAQAIFLFQELTFGKRSTIPVHGQPVGHQCVGVKLHVMGP
jgi:hypothetical protein